MNYSRFSGPNLPVSFWIIPNLPGRCDSSSRQAQAAFPSELLMLKQVPLRGTSSNINNSDENSNNS